MMIGDVELQTTKSSKATPVRL